MIIKFMMVSYAFSPKMQKNGVALVLILFLSSCWVNEGMTPLMFAAKEGNEKEVIRLLDEGAKVNKKSQYDWTALMFASQQGCLGCVQALLNHDADINIVSKDVPSNFATTADYGETNALSEAVGGEHILIANLLIDAGAVVDAASLALAGGQKNIKLLEKMLKKGGVLNRESNNEFHRTALTVASSKGYLEVMKWLLVHGADPNFPAQTPPLRSAVRSLQPDAVRLLLEHGANPNLKQIGGDTALTTAVYRTANKYDYAKVLEIIEILLKNGANQNIGHIGGQSFKERAESAWKRRYEKSTDTTLDPEIRERSKSGVDFYKKMVRLLEKYSG